MTFFVLASTWFVISIARTGRWRDYLWAGFLLGLGVATKYPALLLALVITGTLAARHLNVLSRGELQAAIVGMPISGFRYLIFGAASLATAWSVTTVGVIGFIGLVVPHLVRLVSGSDHRIVVPASALLRVRFLALLRLRHSKLPALLKLPANATLS